MAMRVKNVEAGFYDATGFHPLRSSSDYDPGRAGDDYSPRKPKAKRKKKASGRKPRPKARRASNPRSSVYTPSSKKGVGSKRRKLTKLLARGKAAQARYLAKMHGDTGSWGSLSNPNPIPVKWATAKVRKLGNDIQVMLFPKGQKTRVAAARKRAGFQANPKRRTRWVVIEKDPGGRTAAVVLVDAQNRADARAEAKRRHSDLGAGRHLVMRPLRHGERVTETLRPYRTATG